MNKKKEKNIKKKRNKKRKKEEKVWEDAVIVDKHPDRECSVGDE